eukprot:9542651-Alexandrium_andersonii.AAC.1
MLCCHWVGCLGVALVSLQHDMYLQASGVRAAHPVVYVVAVGVRSGVPWSPQSRCRPCAHIGSPT